MSQHSFSVTVSIRAEFAWLESGAWERVEVDDKEYAWEFSPRSTDRVEFDAWEVRKEFLSLSHGDRAGLQHFLEKTGPFFGLGRFSESELWHCQAALRQELLNPTLSNQGGRHATGFRGLIRYAIAHPEMNFRIWLENGRLMGTTAAIHTFDAILSTIVIDRLRKLRFEVCARPDCASIYELTSRHERKYCSYDCAHLMSVRRSRSKTR